jgi:RNA polymerase sigma-70 factor (ECF subfamily)
MLPILQRRWSCCAALIGRRSIVTHVGGDTHRTMQKILRKGFFARLLEKGYLHAADRAKGRFRQFVLMAFKRFLTNQWDREQRLKRGGDTIIVPLDTDLAERLYRDDAAYSISPDAAFERRWALSLLDRAATRLRTEFETAGKTDEFRFLKPFLTADRNAISYSQIARALGTNEGAARVSVHRMRKRFGRFSARKSRRQ